MEIGTGRTHQIRAQAAGRGHPLWGDFKYGGKTRNGGFFLHALSIDFPEGNPAEVPAVGFGGAPRTITAPLPEAFTGAIKIKLGPGALAKLKTLEIM
jgi:23S rRNA pseudouridine955/2504/2580 synthase